MEDEETKLQYTCSMHPQIIRDEAVNCPLCSMALIPLQKKDKACAGHTMPRSMITDFKKVFM